MTASGDPLRQSPNTLTYGAEWEQDNSSGYFDFVDSNIEVRNPNLAPNCLTYGCKSYAWLAMGTQANGNGVYQHAAQYGPLSGYYSGNGTIVGAGTNQDECYATDSNGNVTNFYVHKTGTSSVGDSPHYRIHYGTDPDGQNGNKIFVLGGTIQDWCGGNGGGNPFTFTPNLAQAGTEIHDVQTQLPGSTSTHEHYASATVTDPSSGTKDFFGSGFGNGFWVYQRGVNTGFIGKQVGSVKTNMDEWDGDCS